jgi:DNA polymerase III alpha subunit (gram-positive type)
MMTGQFFLDTEYTNGNYYLGDIFEIALVSENTHRTFRQYVKIPYAISKRVKKVCNINDEVLRHKGVEFTYMIKRLCEFVKSETTTPTLIAHNGYLCDYPLLFANCMKYNLEVEDIFDNYIFVDSIKVLECAGCRKPELKTISRSKFAQHNAV